MFLKAAGGVTVLVAGAGVWRALDQGAASTGTGPAYEAWDGWRAQTGPLGLLSAAILAASPHNTQPWLFRVAGTRIDLFTDRRRHLGAIDPLLREMHLGLGCALENLLLAARAAGHAPTLQLEPDPSDATHVARVELGPGRPEPSPLYEAIPRRRTNRGPYDRTRPVSQATLDALAAAASEVSEVQVVWLTGEAERRRMGDLLVEATSAIVADVEQAEASFAWFRHDWDDVQARKDGLTVDTLGIPGPLRVAAKMLPTFSRQQLDSGWLRNTRRTQVPTAAAFGILTVSDSRDNRLRVQGGRAFQRLHLKATVDGVALQPMSQLTERIDREASRGGESRFRRPLHESLGGREALMVFRLGYPIHGAPVSPRRPVRDVVLSSPA